MTTKPDYAAMTLAQQVEAWNEISATKRKSPFKNRAAGAAALDKLWSYQQQTRAPAVEEALENIRTTPKGKHRPPVRSQTVTEATETQAVIGEIQKKGRQSKRMGYRVEILTATNPRRQKTAGHEYFAKLKASATVGDYFAQFEGETALRDARLWLYFNVRDGYAKLVP